MNNLPHLDYSQLGSSENWKRNSKNVGYKKLTFKSYPIFEMDQIKVRCLILDLGRKKMNEKNR